MVYRKICTYYLLLFFGIGALYPLLGIYLDDIGINGSKIGTILSVGPIAAIIAQPLWGMISDRYRNHKRILTFLTFTTGLVSLGFLLSQQYIFLIIMFAILSFFQSATGPLADSIAVNYANNHGRSYGSIRLWGAVGYAFAVWITGMIVEITFSSIIFYIFALFLFISTFFANQMPSEAQTVQSHIRSGIIKLIKIPSYVVFLLSSFLIFGALNASNFYFGIYYTALGGTIAGVGLAFFIAAGCEVPFMKFVDYFIEKFGIIIIILFAASLLAFRYFFFYTQPSPPWIMVFSVLQGISVGFLIPASVQLVRNLTPREVQATGMSLYVALGNGLGAMTCTLIGGYLYEYVSITSTFLFFGGATVGGVLLLFGLVFLQHKETYRKSSQDYIHAKG